MRGELVCMRLFDLGADVDRSRVMTLLGRTPSPAPVEAQSPVPPSSTFPKPLEVQAPCPESGVAGATAEVRLHALGVLSVRYRIPVEAASLAGLSGALAAVRIGGLPVDEAAARLCDGVRAELGSAVRDPYGVRVAPERYDVFCVHAAPEDVPRLLGAEAHAIAQLISGSAGQPLVPPRLAAAAKHTLQYTPGDAVVVGWDHAVVLDGPGEYEDMLDVMELANLELLEFRTYDAYLDARLESAFDALDRLWAPGGFLRSARSALQDISRLRVELARLTDNLHDTGKVFGDWYTAQLHRHLHDRFHLSSWERAVASKMATLEDMFHLAQEEANHRRSLVLEAMIVLLFVLDLFILLRVEA